MAIVEAVPVFHLFSRRVGVGAHRRWWLGPELSPAAVYFEFRLAFVGSPDVRIALRDAVETAELVVALSSDHKNVTRYSGRRRIVEADVRVGREVLARGGRSIVAVAAAEARKEFVGRAICVSKVRYESAAEADAALWALVQDNLRGRRRFGKGRETQSYRCPWGDAEHFHLTSQT